jgi:uncharacterized membrane protein YbhN (UPF0104 family)
MQMSARRLLIGLIAVANVVGVYVLVQRTGSGLLHAVVTPDWGLLAAGFAICAGVQPLRAWAWSSTVRAPVGFRAVYAASSVGSFLDTVLPGRMGEAAKVAVLKVSAGSRYPGFSRAGGSLLCAHLLEAIAFAIVGAGSIFFLPVPDWAKATVLFGFAAATGGLLVVSVVHRHFGRRLPTPVGAFLDGAAAPRAVMLRAGLILVATWLARWFGILFCLQAVGIHVGLGAALLYMLLTGLANTAPLLPGNVGVYQAAAIGALALVGYSGAPAAAASVLTPVVVSLATAAAAAVGLALYGRRFLEIPRAALNR